MSSVLAKVGPTDGSGVRFWRLTGALPLLLVVVVSFFSGPCPLRAQQTVPQAEQGGGGAALLSLPLVFHKPTRWREPLNRTIRGKQARGSEQSRSVLQPGNVVSDSGEGRGQHK